MKATITIVDDINGTVLADLGIKVQNFTVADLIEAATIFMSSIATVSADAERGTDEEEAEKPTPATYKAVLTGIADGQLIHVVREIRAFAGLPLKEAKDMADLVKGGEKVTIKDGLTADETIALKATFEKVGATVEIG